MPYCKHIALHTTVGKSLRYILNPDKTEKLLYATSINCITDAKSAAEQMALVYNQFARDKFTSPPPLSGKGTVKAIHYIQSFPPDESISPELAHKIAKAFLRKAFGDDVQAVIATHVDKDHLHSHIIINSYSLSGKKYYANRESLKRIREISDGVCLAFGIKPSPNLKGKHTTISHSEWEHKKKGTSWKEQIRQSIDELIGSVNSLDELLQTLEERGYEIKKGKYISIKAPGQERFVRTKTLGEEYTEDSLNIRIRYRDMGAGNQPIQDKQSQLAAAYVSIISDVRLLAAQRKKVPRKRIITAAYTAENDLDVYRLSAQLSVINKDGIKSIGDLERRIEKLRTEYEKQRVSANDLIEEYNVLLSLREQAKEYFSLQNKGELSDTEELKLAVCKQAVERNNIHDQADVDRLNERVHSLNSRINTLKQSLDNTRHRYDVYCDIRDTYAKISKGDYIGNLVEEERQRREQEKKNKHKR